MSEWTKPSGQVVSINDRKESIEKAKALGWKRAGEKPKPKDRRQRAGS